MGVQVPPRTPIPVRFPQSRHRLNTPARVRPRRPRARRPDLASFPPSREAAATGQVIAPVIPPDASQGRGTPRRQCPWSAAGLPTSVARMAADHPSVARAGEGLQGADGRPAVRVPGQCMLGGETQAYRHEQLRYLLRIGAGVENPVRLPPSHRLGEQFALAAVGGEGSCLELWVALRVAPAVHGDQQAIDSVIPVLAEVLDGAQQLLHQDGQRRRLGVAQYRCYLAAERGRSLGHSGVDDLVLALEVAVDGAGRQAAAGDDHLHRYGLQAVLLQAEACRLQDVLAPFFPALWTDLGHDATIPQKEGTFSLEYTGPGI